MEKTGIIWTEKTWNPVTGCMKVSQGCKFCYAETIAKKYSGNNTFPNGFDLTLREHKLKDPYKWDASLIFVNSMSDLFWDKIPQEYLLKILRVIETTPKHEYQVLTKRADRLMEFSQNHTLPDNFWAGVTIENADNLHRLEFLKKTKAKIKFVSFEPLIGEIPDIDLKGIDWIIVGGESGSHLFKPETSEKRGLVDYDKSLKKWVPKPECIDWVRKLRDISIRDGVKFFFKQWGGSYPEAGGRELDGRTWQEMPKYPGQNTEIANDYLKHIENKRIGDKEKLLVSSLF